MIQNKNIPFSSYIVPLFFLLLAISFKVFPAPNINTSYGYRSALSSKCLENWHFSNHLFSDLMLYGVIIICILHGVLYYFKQDFCKKYNTWLLLIYAVTPILSGLITELQLQKFSIC